MYIDTYLKPENGSRMIGIAGHVVRPLGMLIMTCPLYSLNLDVPRSCNLTISSSQSLTTSTSRCFIPTLQNRNMNTCILIICLSFECLDMSKVRVPKIESLSVVSDCLFMIFLSYESICINADYIEIDGWQQSNYDYI